MVEYKCDIKFDKVIAYDDNIIIGSCDFIAQDEFWNIIHTEVDRSYQGKGIARKLVEAVILNAKKNNKKVIADCSYAKRIVENNK